jgi:hypothetical protein
VTRTSPPPRSLAATLSDAALLVHVSRLAERERHVTADLIASLAELDARRLYLGAGCSSLFTYCTEILHLSEHAAYGRIEAARAARRFPLILARLAEGAITLTTVCLLAPFLTDDNHEQLLEVARHKRKREVELIVATARPQPIVPSTIRKLPQPGDGGSVRSSDTPSPDLRLPDGAAGPSPAAVTWDASPPGHTTAAQAPARPAIVRPLTPACYKVQFTVSRDTHDRFRRVQDLLRHAVPNGDPAVIFDRALTLLLEHLEKQKLAAAAQPRNTIASTARTRHVPAAVRRVVWARDEGRCAFVGTHGRCTERGFLEFHHVEPFAAGGEMTIANLQLRCRAHNGYEATLYFDPPVVQEGAATYDCSTRSSPSSSDPVGLSPQSG